MQVKLQSKPYLLSSVVSHKDYQLYTPAWADDATIQYLFEQGVLADKETMKLLWQGHFPITCAQDTVAIFDSQKNELFPQPLPILPEGYRHLLVYLNLESFDDVKKYEKLMQQGKIIFIKDAKTADKYIKFKQYLTERGLSLEQHVKKEILGENKFVVALADFQHKLPMDTKHMILWVDGPTINATTNDSRAEELIYNYAREQGLKENDFLFFANLPAFKSIPGILHWHIYVRRH